MSQPPLLTAYGGETRHLPQLIYTFVMTGYQ